MAILEVRQYGRAGVLGRSKDLDCVADVLRCASFASVPVNAFILRTSLVWRALFGTLIQHTPLRGILDEFKMAGVTTVYRCSRVEDGRQIPTASVTVTFTRLTCLSKLIA